MIKQVEVKKSVFSRYFSVFVLLSVFLIMGIPSAKAAPACGSYTTYSHSNSYGSASATATIKFTSPHGKACTDYPNVDRGTWYVQCTGSGDQFKLYLDKNPQGTEDCSSSDFNCDGGGCNSYDQAWSGNSERAITTRTTSGPIQEAEWLCWARDDSGSDWAWASQAGCSYTNDDVNQAPEASNPSPANGATGVSRSPSLSVDVSDSDGDDVDVQFYDASTDNRIDIVYNTPNGGTASTTWSGADSYGTTYSWYTKVDDDNDYKVQSSTWSFTTETNDPPSVSNLQPSGAGTNLNPSISADYSDPEGESGTLYFETGSGTSIGSCNVNNGGSCSVTYEGANELKTQYTFQVYAEDSYGKTSSTTSQTFETVRLVNYFDNTNPTAGSLWVEESSLHWADGQKEYYFAKAPSKVGAKLIYHLDGSGYETSYEGSDTEWSCYTPNQSPSTCTTDATDSVTDGSESLKAAKGDGLCGYGGIARDFTGGYDSVSVDTKANTDNWGRANVMIENSTGVYDLKEWYGGGSSISEGWTRYTFDVSNAGNDFKLIIGNHDDSSSNCDNSDHGWTIWADNLVVDGGSGVSDDSGYGNDGTINGATYTTGKYSEALEFDGSSDYVDTGYGITEGGDYSVSMWVNLDSKGDHEMFFGQNPVLEIGTSNDADHSDLKFYSGDGSSWNNQVVFTNAAPSTGNWVHYTVVSTQGTVYLYKNGNLFDSQSDPGVTGGNSGNIRLGLRDDGGWSYLDGKMDEVRIYDRALGSGKIQNLYQGTGAKAGGSQGSLWIEGNDMNWIDNKGYKRSYITNLNKNQKGLWRLDSTGQVVNDSSGWNNDGTLGSSSSVESSDPSRTTGKFGNALSFDGSDDVVSVGNPSNLQIDSSLSICMWVNPDNLGAQRENPIHKAYGGEFSFTFEDSNDHSPGTLSTYFGSDGGNNGPYATNRWADVAQDGQWSHICWVRDNENQDVRLYKNSNDWSSHQTSSEWESPTTGSNDVQIGNGYKNSFDGKIDEVRVYEQALSQTEIQKLYNGYGSKESSAAIGSTWMESSGISYVDSDGIKRKIGGS